MTGETPVKVKVEEVSADNDIAMPEGTETEVKVKGEPEDQDSDLDTTLKPEETNGKKLRYRPKKRKLYASILKQMEFYYSNANIMKNRLMREMVQGSEFLGLETFLEFNRIKSLTSRVEDLRKALANSDKLELSPDETGIKRKVPFDPKNIKSDAEVEECTVYVENVPRHVDHAWLETIFLNFGPIAYVSLPKFRASNQPKGFAFIEFETAESAQGCIEAYKGENACLPPDMNPAQLMSIQTFSEESQTPDHGKSPSTIGSTTAIKRKMDAEDGVPMKRPRIFDTDQSHTSPSEVDSSRSVSVSVSLSMSAATTPIVTDEPADTDVVESEPVNVEPSKNKRKRKKKNQSEEKLEVDSIHLKVMPKKAWRQLRNRYLNLQRQNMAKLKKQLRDQKLRAQHYQNCDPAFNDFHQNQVEKSHTAELFLKCAAESAEAFKHQIKVELSGESEEEAAISGFIKYVDYDEGAIHAYVRFGEDEEYAPRVTAFIENAQKVFKSARILSVPEALDYKAKVQQALKQKRKEQPRKNVRGKDRLLKAATKSSCHLRFDEGEDAEAAEEVDNDNEATAMDTHFQETDGNHNFSNEPESTTA